MLGREIVDAASIAALTTAILVVGGRDERPSFVPGRHDRRSRARLVTVSGLAVVAVVAAVAVVALFGPRRGRAAPAGARAPLPTVSTSTPAYTGGPGTPASARWRPHGRIGLTLGCGGPFPAVTAGHSGCHGVGGHRGRRPPTRRRA
jgi:hypothetical protein